jgi:hypothetical protein
VKSADAKPTTEELVLFSVQRSTEQHIVPFRSVKIYCPSVEGNNVPEAKIKGPIKFIRRRDRLAIQLGIGTGIVKRRINRGTSVASKYHLKTKMAALAAR